MQNIVSLLRNFDKVLKLPPETQMVATVGLYSGNHFFENNAVSKITVFFSKKDYIEHIKITMQ